jgi:N-methylhydantoinase A
VAKAVLDVVDANMERALRYVSVERGYDPEEFTLVAFGGAGPLHACSLAERLGMRSILVPRWPGLFSALGMVLADEVREVSRTVLGRDPEAEFRKIRLPGRMERFVDARYPGQSYELRMPWKGDFHALHRRRYGYARSAEPEIVNIIVRATVSRPKPRFDPVKRGPAVAERPGVYRREVMGAGAVVNGPCLVMEDNATTYVAAGWRCRVDSTGSLRLWR